MVFSSAPAGLDGVFRSQPRAVLYTDPAVARVTEVHPRLKAKMAAADVGKSRP